MPSPPIDSFGIQVDFCTGIGGGRPSSESDADYIERGLELGVGDEFLPYACYY